MELSKEKTKALALKLQQSRLRLLENQPFYGLLLLHLKFSLDMNAETAYADGSRIAFQPGFLDALTPSEVDFVLMHEILHTALGHVWRRRDDEDREVFNIAADIVVNSNILYSGGLNLDFISSGVLKEPMHNLPDGREGYNFSAEEIYPVIWQWKQQKGSGYKDLTSAGKLSSLQWDNHDKWQNSDDEQKKIWLRRMVDATNLICTLNTGSYGKDKGNIPAFMEVILKELRDSQLDWRTILQNFIQEDITDYSFSPPDIRYEGDFFLPAFNEKEDFVRDILFMVDTSASMSEGMIEDAFSEVKGAVDQFGGKLTGKLGFFDARVYDPVPFENVDDLLRIKPKGRGGTDFDVIFDYIDKDMTETPASIIILTDGYADVPPEEKANGVPVLWLLNNDKMTPEWGKIARIKTRNEK